MTDWYERWIRLFLPPEIVVGKHSPSIGNVSYAGRYSVSVPARTGRPDTADNKAPRLHFHF